MELNDSAKNGDVETAWDSSEVGADAEIEYVPLMRVEDSSSHSQQPNIATLNQPTIEGISTPQDPCGWVKKFAICWFAIFMVWGYVNEFVYGYSNFLDGSFILFPVGLLIALLFRFCWVKWTNYLGYDICENFAVWIEKKRKSFYRY